MESGLQQNGQEDMGDWMNLNDKMTWEGQEKKQNMIVESTAAGKSQIVA